LYRQPTLFIILWAILQPVNLRVVTKIFLSIASVTGAWFLGLWLGKISGSTVSHLYHVGDWVGYSIFLFIGDILHHFVDQYRKLI